VGSRLHFMANCLHLAFGYVDICQIALNNMFVMVTAPINLKKLSEMLGLSQTTVSRALNGFPEVSEKTRKRVQEAANALNYRPSPSAASLATGKTRSIGHVIPVSEHRMINPHFSDFLAGASEIYAAAGYDMLLRMANAGEEEDIYRDFASRRRVDGVVVHGPKTIEPRIDLLKSIDLPFVVHGRSGADANSYSWLDVNNREAFRKGTELLIKQGHANIALINGLESMNFAKRRRAGFEAALEANKIAVDQRHICSADMTETYGHDATLAQLKLSSPPTAIMYASILPAMGGIRALNELGLQPGKDIAIITYDDELSFLQSPDGTDTPPFFTAISSSIQAAGKRVAEMLLQQIDNPMQNPINELWEAEIVHGKTTSSAGK
jgi:LacI family transcriptional regulator